MPCPRALVELAVALGFVVAASAQCANPWLPTGAIGIDGLDQAPSCIGRWDPDGPGPLDERIVFGGAFVAAGDRSVDGFVTFDPANGAWSTLGNASRVSAIASNAAGDLVVAGTFGASGDQIARWNGAAWTLLGPVVGGVGALAFLPNGDLVAAGSLDAVAGVPCARIARWNGTTWSPLGTGLVGLVRGLAVRPNGDVFVVGDLTSAGGVACSNLALWNGATWSSPGAVPWGSVWAVTTMPNGDIVVGGNFASVGGVAAPSLARWNGAAWVALTNSSLDVRGLATRPNGNLLVVGDFPFASLGSVQCNHVAEWDGSSWSSLGSGVQAVASVALVGANGSVYVGGNFARASGVVTSRVARFDGVTWSPLSPWVTDGGFEDVVELANGDLVAGGQFLTLYGAAIRNLARWDGVAWSAFGDPNGPIWSLARLANGDLVAAGWFTSIGGTAAAGIARWDGTNWSPLGSGLSGTFHLFPLRNGDLIAAGQLALAGGVPVNNLARWNGTTWSALGSGTNGPIADVVELPNGDLLVGGSFSAAGGVAAANLARWNGASWSPFGALSEAVVALALRPDGNPVALTQNPPSFSQPLPTPSSAWRWTGTSWLAIGTFAPYGYSGPIRRGLAALPDGDLLQVGSLFVNGSLVGAVRWHNGTWPSVAGAQASVTRLVPTRAGDWLMLGLLAVPGAPPAQLARWSTTCPAIANSTGSGCGGAAGPGSLVATSLPWLGAVCTAQAVGLPNPAVAVQVLGFAVPPTPLAALLSLALPGCVLSTTPDALALVVPSAGAATLSLAIPDAPALTGLAVRQQLVVFELGTGAVVTSVTSTNALDLVLGDF